MFFGYGLSPCIMNKTALSALPPWWNENSLVDIDFVNNRAWTAADGEVAINTLVGSDSNQLYDPSQYFPEDLTENGYAFVPHASVVAPIAFIGTLKSLVLSGSTVALQWRMGPSGFDTMLVLMRDDVEAIEYVSNRSENKVLAYSYTGSYGISSPVEIVALNSNNGDVNKIAITLTSARSEFSLNGSAASEGVLAIDDYPAAGFEVAVVELVEGATLQFITAYAPLPDATGLPALSALPPPEWVPEGADLFLDFENGRYWDGTETTVDAILEADPNWGSFSAADITPGVGLSDSLPIFAADHASTMLASGFTAVFTFTQDQVLMISIADLPAYNLSGFAVQMWAGQPENTNIQTDGGPTTDIVPAVNVGPHVVAAAYNPTSSRISVSVDGEAVVFSSADAPADPAYNTVGMTVNCTVQSITVYALKDDADLPALSTVE